MLQSRDAVSDPDPAVVIGDVLALLNDKGGERYGEDTTQLQHALQCAALARDAGCDEALVAAALLHDIGQLIDEAGAAAERHGIDAAHEDVGATLLATVFAPEVTEPIRLHVAAKRYLCAVDPAYAAGLSAASALSLRLQGGAMTRDAARAFEAEPHFDAAIRLRRFDDMGKRPDLRVPSLDSYVPLLLRVARRRRG